MGRGRFGQRGQDSLGNERPIIADSRRDQVPAGNGQTDLSLLCALVVGGHEDDDCESGEQEGFTSIKPVQMRLMGSSGMQQRSRRDPAGGDGGADR